MPASRTDDPRKLVRGNMIRRALQRAVGTGALLLLLAECRAAAGAFGPTPAAARDNASTFAGAIADRFTRVVRAPKFQAARMRLARYAMTPSKIWGDTGVWTSSGVDSSRTLVVAGALQNGHYYFQPHPQAPLPRRAGDSRHTMRLHMLGADEWEWDTDVAQAVGDARAADVAGAFTALIAAPETRPERDLRADYRDAFPRTTAALGRQYSLDTLRAQRLADGSTALTLGISIHPERLRATMPAFAAYVEKYVKPARYHVVLADRQGGRWLDATARDELLTFRVRSQGGRLLPLDGPARPMPDHLELRADAFAKIMIFTVGVTNLVGQFDFIDTPHERGWLMRFDREPEWHLPLAVAHLIRAPLRRPFERGGTVVRIAVRDSAGAPTQLTREVRTAVKESAILRFMGSLGFTAMNDFAGQSEEEENRFLAEAFDAMRQDVRALYAGAPGRPGEDDAGGR